VLPLALAALLAGSLAVAGPASPATAANPAAAAVPVDGATVVHVSLARPFRIDLADRNDFVAQTNFVQCVGASMQMMLNIIGPSVDRSARTQLTLQKLARSLSGPTRPGFEREGASIRGWMNGLNQLAAEPYRLVGMNTLAEAMRTAALAIRSTGRPVGLLVWRGRHAWVMSGFEATADPLRDASFEVTAAIVLDPLYPNRSATWGPSPRPRQALTIAEVGRQFVPKRSRAWPGAIGIGDSASPLAALTGKYVLVLPYRAQPLARLVPLAI
jgi:hypothetical protein